MTEFLLARHGQTPLNKQRELIGGRSNHTPLSEQGNREADRLGVYMRFIGIQPVLVVDSGAVRTQQTRAITSEAARFNAPVRRDERLLEMSQGRFEGMHRDTVYTPEVSARLIAAGFDGKLPGGESLRDVQLRMIESLQDMSHEFPVGTIVVFSHGLAIRAVSGHIMGSTRDEILHGLRTDNVSLTRITVEAGIPDVTYVGKNVIDR